MAALQRLLRAASSQLLRSSSGIFEVSCSRVGAPSLSRTGVTDEALLSRAAAAALAVGPRLVHTGAEKAKEASFSGLSVPERDPASDSPTAGEGGRQKHIELVAAFTCNKCGTRTARAFSRGAYERGVVIARCGGCEGQHLLSDRLGWFGEAGSAEDFLRERGASVRKHTDGTLEISEEDLTGWTKSTA